MVEEERTAERDADLARRIQAGDREACAQCIEIHAPGVYQVLLRMLGDPAEAEDAMQEVFLNAFRSIGDFGWRSSLSTWLHRIATNVALMRLRRKQPLFVQVDSQGEEGESEAAPVPRQLFDWCCLPEQELESSEARDHLEGAIRALPEPLRLVFVLRELEGLSTEEAAQELGLSAGAVKTRLHRARMALREELSGYFTELAGNS